MLNKRKKKINFTSEKAIFGEKIKLFSVIMHE